MKATTCLRLSVGMCLLALAATATAQNAMTTESADVYAGPDNSYPEVAQLDPDTPIQVMGCLDDWSWCDVGFEGNRGWVYSPDIAYQYQGGYAPLYSYAPGLGVPIVAFSFDTYWGSYYHDRPFYQQRDQWAHRTINHRRPSGPRPSSSPPPHEVVRNIRPHEGPDHGVRLSAEASRQNTERAGAGARFQAPAPDPRHQDRSPPPGPRPEMNARPPGNAAPPHAEPQHEAQHEPQHEEQHARPGPRTESPPHAEPPHAEPPHAEARRAEPQHREAPPHPAPEPPKN